uniref:Uncharacterized protein n=1 Tax=Oryza sativa subsp. japonica TaxID=39947 RepID=Q10A39_ORYSJ|nr:hypothetical protein LOC_Os10g07986 [Oryza sativa Japonica Group]
MEAQAEVYSSVCRSRAIASEIVEGVNVAVWQYREFSLQMQESVDIGFISLVHRTTRKKGFSSSLKVYDMIARKESNFVWWSQDEEITGIAESLVMVSLVEACWGSSV